jgi:hypothetical protein
LVDSTGKRNSGKTERVYRIVNFGKQMRSDSGSGLPSGDALRLPLKWMVPLICLMILCSCGSQRPSVKDNEASNQKVILRNPPKSIAILPFGNKTEVEGIDEFVRTTVYSHLTPHPYKDIELHEVDRKLRRYNLMNYEKLSHVSAKRLGRILRCDAVVLGEVTEHVTRHHEGGIPLAITDLAMISIRSGLNLRDSEKVKTVDELSRHLISRVPVPADPSINPKGSKLVSLKRLTKAENKTSPGATKLNSLKRLTKGDQ